MGVDPGLTAIALEIGLEAIGQLEKKAQFFSFSFSESVESSVKSSVKSSAKSSVKSFIRCPTREIPGKRKFPGEKPVGI